MIAHLTHGTKFPGLEIVKNIKLVRGVEHLKNVLRDEKENKTRLNKNVPVGRSLEIGLYEQEKNWLISAGIPIENMTIFERAKVKGEIFTSDIYKKDITTNSYTVEVTAGNVKSYGKIVFFFFQVINDNKLYLVLKKFAVEHTKMFRHDKASEEFGRPIFVTHILPIKDTDTLRLIDCDEIESIDHLIRVENYVCRQPNHFKAVM